MQRQRQEVGESTCLAQSVSSHELVVDEVALSRL